MKRLLLIALIFTAPAFAQEEEVEKEETQVEIRMESIGGISGVASSGEAQATFAAFPDKSIWSVHRDSNMRADTLFTYCWVDEDNEPHCKEVKPE
ncbi:hypothetical protein N8559_09040 [Gammaproteobacteria bacterium]|nr:hypothetical protein [Gammaproteobacteria bacterium]MDB4004461.1 hypothetical protein [Gammaproteobacteria bacterium]MDB4137511.1 hypothetical protein [Gammaproteobacteria bacterium]MDC1232353.1 hypothetical protein [Gammaproteobacteria bacterium]MDC1358508.1 hypothetical protein [Gammaproteobacteria bacterium]